MAIIDVRAEYFEFRDPTDSDNIYELGIDLYRRDDADNTRAMGTRVLTIDPTVASMDAADRTTHLATAKAVVEDGKTLLVEIADRITNSQSVANGKHIDCIQEDL